MTKRQAEKVRRDRHRKRRRKKRIKAFLILGIMLVLAIFLAVVAIKAVVGLFKDDESQDNLISSTETVSSEDISDSDSIINSESNPETDVSSTGETSSEISSESENITVGEKPEQSWSTMLVNVWNYMPEGYVPEVREINYKGVSPLNNKFDVRAADALEQMLADARAAGYNMYLVSAYRTHEYQVNLYNRKVNEYLNMGYDEETAKSEASQWVAIPGTSEHCTGLAADIVSSTWFNYNSDLTHDFEDTEHFEWLYEHCADYGFILRYPKGKEAVTAITYEPWHYRYVGVEAAKYIMENNITLEEFHGQ